MAHPVVRRPDTGPVATADAGRVAELALAVAAGHDVHDDVLALLDRAVGADNLAFSRSLALDGSAVPRLDLRGTVPLSSDETRLWQDLLPEHPYARHVATGPVAASRLTDVMTVDDLERTEVYDRLLRERGSRFQAALPLAQDPRCFSLLSLWREAEDFTDAELARLEALRRPLAAAWTLREELARLRVDEETVALTPRQAEVARLVARGLTNAAVAGRLGITARTVRKHLEDVFDRTGCRSRTELAVWWNRSGCS